MFSFNSSLRSLFNSHASTLDAGDLCKSLVIYANQYYNYYKSDNCDVSLKKEMKAKARKYKLRLIADFKKKILKNFDRYAKAEEMKKDFKDACGENWHGNWHENLYDFFEVLDWVIENWGCGRRAHYFECFVDFSENEPIMVHAAGFEDYAMDLGKECYLSGIIRDDRNNPILGFIDWEGWADFIVDDYTEIENPLNKNTCIYYIGC